MTLGQIPRGMLQLGISRGHGFSRVRVTRLVTTIGQNTVRYALIWFK
jgi:hypothetical protein